VDNERQRDAGQDELMSTLSHKRPNASAPPGADAKPRGPSFSPGFLKRMPIVQKVPEVAPGTVISYDRSILVEPVPLRPIPLANSEFSRLERGPIRNFYVRDWYWRAWWNGFSDTVFPNAHVLPRVDGIVGNLPGGTAMVPRSRLTHTLSTPAWTIEPSTQEATSNA
jgi:hypothetical protein